MLLLLLYIQDVATVSPLEEMLAQLEEANDDVHPVHEMFDHDDRHLLHHAASYHDELDRTVYEATAENRSPTQVLSRKRRAAEVSPPTTEGDFFKFRVDRIGDKIDALGQADSKLEVSKDWFYINAFFHFKLMQGYPYTTSSLDVAGTDVLCAAIIYDGPKVICYSSTLAYLYNDVPSDPTFTATFTTLKIVNNPILPAGQFYLIEVS